MVERTKIVFSMVNVTSNKNQGKHKLKNIVIIAVVALALVVGGAFYMHQKSVQKAQKSNGKVASVSPKSIGNPTNTATRKGTDTKASTTTTGTDQKEVTPSAPTKTLLVPTGNFVSNHMPGANGTSTAMQSVCNTTPGATCNIRFVSSQGITKDLGTKTADSSGTASWNWDIDGSNMAPGPWKITAVATLGDQTKTAEDTIKLEVR
jgi:flagellar basal body-associated protein FliL